MEPVAEPAPAAPAPADYLRAARSPRMLVLFAVLLAAAVGAGTLGAWQLDRARERGEVAAQRAASEAADLAPVPLTEELLPQTPLTGEQISTRVTATGQFGEDLLVADRVVAGRTGFLVLTPLWVEVDGGQAVIAVVRGWVPDAEAVTPAPTGVGTVVGHLRPAEATGRDTMPPGQLDAVSPAELVNRWGGPIWSAYLLLTEPEQPGLTPVPLPEPETGLNTQNLAYAVQWWIFGGFALAVWLRLVRDEARAAPPNSAKLRRGRLFSVR